MKQVKKFLVVVFLSVTVLLPAGAETLLLMVRASPVQGVGTVPGAQLRPLTDLVESSVLDQCFELGFVVSTFPPVLSESSLNLASSPADLRQTLWNADDLRAQYLVLVSFGSGPVPKSGDPEIRTARLEVHRISDGTFTFLDIPASPPLALDLGKLIASRLKSFL